MSFVIGAPAAPSSSSRVIASVKLVGEVRTALPCGRVALSMLGGKMKVVEAKEGNESAFPEEKINVPVGVTPQTLKNYTFYNILGFDNELGDSADTEVIKKAYHKAVLLYHPDKAQHKTADGKEDRSVFLKIQEAFNVLTNDQKRRAYDSQLPFDESIPTEEKVLERMTRGPQKFFKIFAPVFQRNARFAVKKPVPDLGNMDTPLPQVYKFYEYWVKFESWRDFTGKGAEHNPDSADSREEKRWMMKENEKLAKKLKKKEMERLIQLVALAERHDPRINADKQRRKDEKEAIARRKEEALQRKANEDAASVAWAEALEAAEREKRGAATKADKEKMKKQQSRCRNTLRKLLRASAARGHGSGGEYGILSEEEVDVLCGACLIDDLTAMNEAMGGEAAAKDSALLQEAGFQVVRDKVVWARRRSQEVVEDEQIAKEAAKKEQQWRATPAGRAFVLQQQQQNSPQKKSAAASAGAAEPAPEREWSAEEAELFPNCVERYGPGSGNAETGADRFQLMANFMNVKTSPAVPFSRDECLIAAYRLSLK